MRAMVISLINFDNYVMNYMTAEEVRKTAFLARLPETPKPTGDDFFEGTAKDKYDAGYERIFGAK